MSNINDIKTIYSAVYTLGLLAILALGLLIVPMNAEAAQNYVFNSSVNVSNSFPVVSNTSNMNYVPTSYTNNSYYPVQTPQAHNYYPYNPAPVQTTYVVPTVDSSNKTVAKASTTTTTKKATTTTAKTEVSDKYEALAANAIWGDVGFLPSGLLQWILFAIMVLIIVILTRRVFGGSKRYHETPLKHA